MPEAADSVKGFFKFYLRSLRWAVSGAWGDVGLVTTLLPLVTAFLLDEAPSWMPKHFVETLNALGGWKIPCFIGLALLFIRFLIGPYTFYEEERKKVEELDEFIRPKVKLSCHKSIAGSVVETLFDGMLDKHYKVPVNYFRIRVKSEAMKPIRKCTGFLTRIKRGDEIIMGHESLQLTFAPAADADSHSKTLYPRVSAYLDVLAILQTGQIEICTKGFATPFSIGGKIFDKAGSYTLSIAVSGTGMASVKGEFTFNWTGDWQTAELSLNEMR